MYNNYIYYKYIVRPQLLIKFPLIGNNLNSINLKKILFNVYYTTLNKDYYVYLYNICILLRLLTNKVLFIKKLKKTFSINKMHFQINIKKLQMYQFIDMFSSLLLPLFENFNMSLNINNFDIFGNFFYEFNYVDPIFTAKNAVTAWTPANKINIKYCFNSRHKDINFIILQYLKLKWYKQ